MASGLVALIAALLALVASLAAGDVDRDEAATLRPVETPEAREEARDEVEAQNEARDEVRLRAEEIVRSSLARAGLGEPAGAGEERPDATASAAAHDRDRDGCEVEEASGDGWTRTEVGCVQESQDGSSRSVSSSRSVNVQRTNSSDDP